MSAVPELSPAQLRAILQEKPETILLDVRNPFEFDICALPKARYLPLPELPSRIDELEQFRDLAIVVYCHHGVRSLSAAAILINQGFRDVRSLRGGIDAWAASIDPKVSRY